MAKQTINTIKNWFRTGNKPTQAQFWDWLDSFFHKDDNIPSGQVEGLQGLLDAKMDKTEASSGSNSGPYDPDKDYVFDSATPEYVSYINADSDDTFFQSEKWYRLKEDAPARENPETNPEHWAYQGTVLGDLAIDDILGLREEINKKSYTLDFNTNTYLVQEINMLGPGVIERVVFRNVASLVVTYSGGVQVQVAAGDVGLEIVADDILTWEITRTNDSELAAVGIELQLRSQSS
jgi:hypothetical protein